MAREFNLVFREHFSAGLRPDTRVNRNKAALVEAKNVEVTKFGLETTDEILDPFNGTVSSDHPFPQVFLGESESFIIDRNQTLSLVEISLIDTSTNPWMIPTSFSTRDGRTLTGFSTIPFTNKLFHFADSKESWFLFNGDLVLFKVAKDVLGLSKDIVYVLNDISINTGIYHRGRYILGGFDPDDFWNANWQELFEHWRAVVGKDIPFSFNDVGTNYVLWSSIGGGDFPLYLFYPDLASTGVFGEGGGDFPLALTETALTEAIRKGEFGFMPMPWNGEVKKLIPLGDNIIVYGDRGISALIPSKRRRDPNVPPTYGLRKIANFGTPQRDSAFGSENTPHFFIDNSGKAWTLNSDLQLQELGYEEFFFPMLSNRIVINYNDEQQSFYISDGTKGYIFNKGLTQVSEFPISASYIDGGFVGITDNDLSGDNVLVTTTAFDFGVRGSKTVTAVLLGLDSLGKTEVAMDWRNSKSESFKRSPFFPVNNFGQSELRVTGGEFRLVIKNSNITDFNLDYAEIRYQIEDRRFIRGVSSSTSSS